MSIMPEPFVDLEAVFAHAVKETQEMIKYGFYLSDPCIVTPLGWYANKYPEIAERCNNALMELIDKQDLTYFQLVTVPAEEYEDAF
jgi:hypothetical protein